MREGVGEIGRRQFVKHLIAKNLEESEEPLLLMLALLADQLLA
ncbi:MAG: hypothetical protein ACR65U_09385 [Methylocystis sp.]